MNYISKDSIPGCMQTLHGLDLSLEHCHFVDILNQSLKCWHGDQFTMYFWETRDMTQASIMIDHHKDLNSGDTLSVMATRIEM